MHVETLWSTVRNSNNGPENYISLRYGENVTVVINFDLVNVANLSSLCSETFYQSKKKLQELLLSVKFLRLICMST